MLFPIRNMGDVGVIKDVPPYDLPPNAFTDALNVKFRDGKVTRANGWEQIEPMPAGQFPRWCASWRPVSTDLVAIATSTATSGEARLSIWNGTTLTSVNDTLTDADFLWSNDYSMTVFGEWLIVNNGSQAPWVYGPADSFFRSYGDVNYDGTPGIGSWPTEFIARGTVRSYKGYLIALDVQVTSPVFGLTAGLYPQTVFWSDVATLNDLPASWDISDPTVRAGFSELPEDEPLIDCLPLADANILYLRSAAYAQTLTGGRFLFTFRKLFDRGLLNRDCVVAFDNYHFCVGQDVIYVHDGLRIQRPADDKIERYFYDDIAVKDSVKVTHDPDQKEIYIYYQSVSVTSDVLTDGNDGAPRAEKAICWNYEHNTWTIEELPAVCLASSFYASDQLSWQDLQDLHDAVAGSADWEDYYGQSWADLFIDEDRRGLFFLSTDYTVAGEPNGAYKLFNDDVYRDTLTFDAWCERTYLDLDEAKQTASDPMFMRRAFPQVSGVNSTGDIYFRFGGALSPNESIAWVPQARDFTIGEDYKADTRVTGRYLAWRGGNWTGAAGEAPSSTALWEMSGMDIELDVQGRR